MYCFFRDREDIFLLCRYCHSLVLLVKEGGRGEIGDLPDLSRWEVAFPRYAKNYTDMPGSRLYETRIESISKSSFGQVRSF